jgi:hypothetical protein
VDANGAVKAVHDLLVDMKPDGVSHSCPMCASEEPGGPVTTKTYTEDEVQAMVTAAVTKATSDLAAEIASMKESATAGEIDTKIAEATKPINERVAELESQLEAKTVEAETAKAEAEGIKSWLQEQADADAATAARDERKAARLQQVKDAELNLKDEFLEAQADRWADLSDEAFADALQAMVDSAAAVKASLGGKVVLPADPAVKRTPITASDNGGPTPDGRKASSDLSAVFAMRGQGQSVRSV